jgi:hypothetical protein
MRVSARAIATIAAAASLAPLSLHAQATPAAVRTPRVELSVDYSHFGVTVGNTEGTNGNRMVGLEGGSASLALNFNRFFGVVADVGGYDANKLELVGNGANQPRVVAASGTAYTYLFGPRVSYRNHTRFTPFLQVLAGGVHASPVTVTDCSGSACAPLPAQNAFSMTAGGGLDIGLTHLLSLRAFQAEYMMTRFPEVPSGASASQDDLRLSAGIVLRFAGKTVMPAPQLACSVQPQSAFAGDPLVASATAASLNPKHPAVYAWTSTGGTVTGTDSSASIQTVGLAPGSYTVSATVTQGSHARQQATCTAPFTIQSPEPPTVSCSALPNPVMTGATVNITAQAASPQNRSLTYSYATSAGHITGNSASAVLTTDGVDPGLITVTCTVVDDLGKSASASAAVTVSAPAPAEAPAAVPQTSNLCSISFERDRRRPLRVDNEAKACLDDIALQMQRESSGHLVLVGSYSSDEKPHAAEERARHEYDYLTGEKGIDSQRIELRVGDSGHRSVANVFVPAGATYAPDNSRPIDPTSK